MTPPDRPFEEAFSSLIGLLDSLAFPYCLLGALALGAWGTPRTTQDVDVFIGLEPSDHQRLLEAMEATGFSYDAQWAEANPMIREVHLRFQRGPIPCDLLLPRDDHDREILPRRQRVQLGDRDVWVISAEDLILHKLKVGRAQDFVDVLSVLHHQKGALDLQYVESWSLRLGIREEWNYCQQQMKEGAHP